MSETENLATAIVEEKIQKPVKNDSVSTDEVDRVATAEKTVLNGDSDHSKETEKKDIEEAVTEKPTGSETCNAQPPTENSDIKTSTDNAEAAPEIIVEAASKVAEPKQSDESSVSDFKKPPEKAVSDAVAGGPLNVEEKSAASHSDVSEAERKCEKSDDVESSSVEAEKPATTEKDADKVEELFTNDMVKNIEQNYSPTETDAVNLLEMPDDEMFGTEAKATETNDAAKTNGTAAEKTDEIAEAANLFLQGKRNMLVKDYESAADILGEACAKYSAIYGDLGVECAEVYMVYGQALLESWRLEDSNRKSSETLNETKGDEEEAVAAVADEPPVKENGIGGEAQPEKEEATDDEPMDTDQADEVAPDAENAEETIDETCTDEQVENGDGEDEDDIESADDVDNLQIAFEILEMAKKIYEKTNDNANLAKVHSKLGEISIASGNLAYAVEDLKRALELLSPAASVDVRHKANVHFQLYIVHTMRCSFPEAETELRVAKSTFESHLRDLERKLETADKSKASEVDAIASEIKEIKEVIQDLNTKMAESHREKRELISAISDVIKTKHSVSADMPSSSSASVDAPSSSSANAASTFSPRKADVPINNISHLVRKKPKNVPEEVKVEEKQVNEKTDEVSSTADAKSNGVEAATNVVKEAADTTAESSTKRKAEDALEGEAKKVCA